MTAQEIIDFLDDLYEQEGNEIGQGDIDEDLVSEKLGKFEYIKECDRNLFDTDSVETVIHFIDHDIYIGYSGIYDSWNGDEIDEGPYEVKPVEKTIIIYEKQ